VWYLAERVLSAPTAARPREWAAHLDFLADLERRGLLVAGGPLADGCAEALVLAVRDEASVHRALRADPLAAARLIVRTRVREWAVRFGDAALTGRAGDGAEPEPTDLLTPHQARIARLVVAGCTNQHIADQLGVSCRAVEQHLTRIYRALAISRRAQLADALRTAGAPQPGKPRTITRQRIRLPEADGAPEPMPTAARSQRTAMSESAAVAQLCVIP